MRDLEIRAEMLDDQYDLVGKSLTSSKIKPDALVISIGLARSLAENNPDIKAILRELECGDE